MPAAITIRDDISSAELRHVARRKTDRRVVCRLLAIANALDGMSRERAAEQAGMDRQALRDWVIRYNADGVDGLHDRPRSGRPSFLDEGQMAVFRAMVLRGPDIERDGVSSWTAKDLCLLVERRFKTWIAAAEKASGQSAYQEALGLVDSAADHLAKIQDKILRRELEISVELARADVRQILDGPTETAKAAYTRVRDLTRKAGDHRLEFIGAWGLWFNDQQSNDLSSVAKRASKLIPLAELTSDPDCELQANHANWTTAFYSGDLISTKKFAQEGYKRYDPQLHYPALLRFGSHDAGCCARYHLAKSNCLLGYPETGARFFKEGVGLARGLEHPGSLVVALVIQVIIQQMTGDIDAVEYSSQEFGALADRHGMARFAPVSRVMLGWVDACRNEGQRAIDNMKGGIEGLENTGGLMRLSYYKGLLADAFYCIGNVDTALATVDDGIAFVKSTGEGWYLPELYRLKGALLLEASDDDEGVRHLKIALDLARKTSAKWFELRTTTSLAARLADRGEPHEARQLLEPIYNWFTDGSDTPDLGRAEALLQELSSTIN